MKDPPQKSPAYSLQEFIQKYYIHIFVGIILLAALLRFANYDNRWGLAYDQAHDAIIARFALSHFKLPLLGPFSSAGPFQTGGEWYWFIMVGTALFPFSPVTPWIFLTLFYIFFVAAIMYVGKKLVNRKFALMAGFLAAVSPAEIAQGINLTNQSPLALCSLASLWFGILYIRNKRSLYIFLSCFFASLGASIHLQGVELGIIPVISYIVAGSFLIPAIFFAAFGFILPWIPVGIADSSNHFKNFANMLYYARYGQYNISLEALGRNWKNYLGVFWPNSWATIIGGYLPLGYIAIILSVLIGVWYVVKKRISREWILICGSFLIMFIYLRYIHTPLFDSYLVFLHPFVLLITAGFCYTAYKFQKIFGIILLALFVCGSLFFDYGTIIHGVNFTKVEVTNWENALVKKYPHDTFAIYDYLHDNNGASLAFVLYLQTHGKINDNGKRIGLVGGYFAHPPTFPIIMNINDTKFEDLSSSSSAQLAKNWKLIDPSKWYTNTEDWYKK